mmetsp:Transcript_32328/g.93118  ORF Transcript_32328/g.93118 Transcript_32328/m.93118 type:complete len:210 (-) Transcript_32328:29-658(-)
MRGSRPCLPHTARARSLQAPRSSGSPRLPCTCCSRRRSCATIPAVCGWQSSTGATATVQPLRPRSRPRHARRPPQQSWARGLRRPWPLPRRRRRWLAGSGSCCRTWTASASRRWRLQSLPCMLSPWTRCYQTSERPSTMSAGTALGPWTDRTQRMLHGLAARMLCTRPCRSPPAPSTTAAGTSTSRARERPALREVSQSVCSMLASAER